MDPAPPINLHTWRWPALLIWALAFSLWAAVLIGATISAASTWSTWRHVVHAYERDAETIVYDEMFPSIPPHPLRSAADAAEGVASANREYGADLAFRAGLAAVLAALAFGYRRAVPAYARPPRRVWIFVLPVVVVLGGAVLIVGAIALAGAIKG